MHNFLVDTRSEVSVVPPSHNEKSQLCGCQLVEANGSIIRTYGEKEIKLKLGAKHYEWDVDIADVQRPLLGADFLHATSLLVDVR